MFGGTRGRKASMAGVTLLLFFAAAGNASADRRPVPLSHDKSSPNISSAYGSGNFGRWKTDGTGLPSYRYETDEETVPRARQAILDGGTDAWHQLGNDRFVANAYNHGYTQFWTQERRYEWLNRYDAAAGHFGGGYGYLNLGGRVISTLYDDRPAGAEIRRVFGTGYSRSTMRTAGVKIDQHVYAPFGNDPVLLHEVTLRNTGSAAKRATWFEYWDVNPFDQHTGSQVGLGRPAYDAAVRTLTVEQTPDEGGKTMPIFAAALKGPVAGYETSGADFFGDGGRANPRAVAAGQLGGGIAEPVGDGQVGDTMFSFRSPVRLAPGKAVTLRYAYGYGSGQDAPGRLVRKYRNTPRPLAASQRAWKEWLPRIRFGTKTPWLSRELQWDAYTLRSASVYEQCRGRHVITQGGYYMYDWGSMAAYRDPLQHLLPMIYADPALARDALLFSAQGQPREGVIPWSMGELCEPANTVSQSNDPDLWLLLAAAEYGLATRDRSVFSEQVVYQGGGEASLWAHLKQAFRHQESLRTARGTYLSLENGDWSDLSTAMLGMDESALVTAQLAYIYPRMAQLAELRGDRRFARELRRAGRANLGTTRTLWTGGGWYGRGYSGDRLLGQGVIFGEPQPWAILAGAPTPAQSRTLVANIRRYLTGVGTPGGPSPIGSAMSPALDDPGVTETSTTLDPALNSAVFPGQTWFAINGWLVWALGKLDGTVDGARKYAFDEFRRNTLAAHANAYPDQWDGIISIDDMCRSWYSKDKPGYCGIFEPMKYQGQIMHQPAWSLFDSIKLAGVEPRTDGYRITPHLPQRSFSLRMSHLGVAYSGATARGYIQPRSGGTLRMSIAAPGGRPWCRVAVEGRSVRKRRHAGMIRFRMPTEAGRKSDWTVRCPSPRNR